MRRRGIAVVVLASALLVPSGAVAQAPPAMPGSFERIGHEPLMNRGMNAAHAVYGGYAYVGSRTDGSHANAGVMVVDVRNPAAPKVVKEMGPPDEGLPTQSSREMRILPDQKLLIILNHQCNEAIHRCASPSNSGATVLPSNFKVFDIAGANAADPKLVATILPSASSPQTPHEFFVWSDPKRSGRVLMYYTDPGANPEVVVTDLSRVREGVAPEIAGFAADAGGGVHSLTVSNDGRRMFLAALTGGFIEADSSEVADAKPDPKITQVTPQDNAPTWEGPGAHSAVRLPGRDPARVLVSDEVYGQIPLLLSSHGCPWGWVRIIDDSKPVKPFVIAEYKLPYNQQSYCDTVSPDRNTLSSFAAHNPTLTENLALITWHSGGLQAIDTTSPATPTGAASYSPEPLPAVQTEDPALSSGPDKVVMWSFPIVVDGLVYVVDLRNGLYILRYHGPHEEEVARARFLDGNSNSGDMQRLDPIGGAAPGGAGGSKPPTGAGPAVGGPAPCLARPRLRARSLGPFKLGMTPAQAALRGGPRSGRAWCVTGGGKIAIAYKRGRAVAILTSAKRVRGPKRLSVGARSRVSVTVVRGRVAVARRGRVIAVGVAAGKPSPGALRRLAAAAR